MTKTFRCSLAVAFVCLGVPALAVAQTPAAGPAEAERSPSGSDSLAAGPTEAERSPSGSDSLTAGPAEAERSPSGSDSLAAGPAEAKRSPSGSDSLAALPSTEQRPLAVARAEYRPGKGLAFTSADENFDLAIRLRAQFLYSVARAPESERLEHALQVRRARLQFVGHVFGEHNKYKAEFGFSPRDQVMTEQGAQNTVLLDWYAEFDHVRDLTLRLGQYKVPFNRHRVISSGDLQMVDRAMAQGEFQLDRDIGLHFSSPDLGGLGLFKYYAGVWLNEGRDAYDFRPYANMYIARVEVLPFGMFDDYKESDLKRRSKPGLSVGAAYAFLDDASHDRGILGEPPDDAGTTDFHLLTADLLFKYRGASLQGEFYYRHGSRNAGVGSVAPPRNGLGWFLQGGYLLPTVPFEVAARYSEIHPEDADSGLGEQHSAGMGVSWYPGDHSLKLQADYFRVWRGDALDEGDDTARLQLQLAY